jgi:hypothetical protein
VKLLLGFFETRLGHVELLGNEVSALRRRIQPLIERQIDVLTCERVRDR